MSKPKPPRTGTSRLQRVLRGVGDAAGRPWSVPAIDMLSGEPISPVAEASEQGADPGDSAEEVERVRTEMEQALAAAEARHAEELERLRREAEVTAERAAADLAKQRSHIRRTVAALRVAVADLQAARSQATLEVERRVIELSFSIASRVVGAVVEERAHDVEALVRGALQEARSAFPGAEVLIRLHPEDARRIEGVAVELGAVLRGDEALELGDVRVEAGDGQVWDGVEARLDALASALLGGRRGA